MSITAAPRTRPTSAAPTSTTTAHGAAGPSAASAVLPVAVLIPAYKPGPELITLVSEIRAAAAPDRILVVDDGSVSDQGSEAADYHRVFTAIANLPGSGIEVLRYTPNRGKGAALKLGMERLHRDLPGAAIITADADGQHTPRDIARLADRLRANAEYAGDQPMVLGVREFGGDVPARSRFGNRVASLLFFASTGVMLRDTQTGLRGIPAGAVDLLLDVPGRRYEYELSALLTAAREGLDMDTLTIDTVYLDNNATSHFRPLRDSLRVMAPMLGFAASGLGAFAIDTALFLALTSVAAPVWAALLGARVVSGFANFAANRYLVFSIRSRSFGRALLDYLALALVILVLGMGMIQLLVFAGVPTLVAKIGTDLALFVGSFAVQSAWARRSKARG